MAVTLRRYTADPNFVKPICVWQLYNFFNFWKFVYIFSCLQKIVVKHISVLPTLGEKFHSHSHFLQQKMVLVNLYAVWRYVIRKNGYSPVFYGTLILAQKWKCFFLIFFYPLLQLVVKISTYIEFWAVWCRGCWDSSGCRGIFLAL